MFELKVKKIMEFAIYGINHHYLSDKDRLQYMDAVEEIQTTLLERSDNSEYVEIKMCSECGIYPADLPGELCQGCAEYKNHF